jgi:FLVCR family feline leukemia virus subgroup C receptor-related protein
MVLLIFYVGSLLAIIVFTATLNININLLYGTIFILGFFMCGYISVGFELAIEVTFPEPEGLSCGLLNSSAQVKNCFYKN